MGGKQIKKRKNKPLRTRRSRSMRFGPPKRRRKQKVSTRKNEQPDGTDPDWETMFHNATVVLRFRSRNQSICWATWLRHGGLAN